MATDKHEPDTWALNDQHDLIFHVADVQNALLNVEVFADFSRRQDDACYVFDQSLGTGVVKLQCNESTWIKLSSEKSYGNPELLLSTSFENAADIGEHTPSLKNAERVCDTVHGDTGRPSTTGPSWRNRFSNAFSRAMSNASVTTPPPARAETVTQFTTDEAADDIPAVASSNDSSGVYVSDSNTAIRELKEDDTDMAVVETIENFHDLHGDKSDSLVAFESSTDKKSRRWRKSLALLTGEDMPGVTGSEAGVGSGGNFFRMRRHSSGRTDSTEDDGSSHSRATPSPTKDGGMRSALRRLSAGTAGGDTESPKRRSLTNVFLRRGKQFADHADPLSVDDGASTEPEECHNLGGEMDESTDMQADVRGEMEKEEIEGGDCDDVSEPDQVSRRTNSVDSQGNRVPVDVHPLCCDGIDPTSPAIGNTATSKPPLGEVFAGIGAKATEGPCGTETTKVHTEVPPLEIRTSIQTCTDDIMQRDPLVEPNDDDTTLHVDRIEAVEAEFVAAISADLAVVGVFSESPCLSCGHLMFDDEVMASWGGFCDNSRPKDGDIVSAHVILCPSCKAEITPTLHVRHCHLLKPSDAIAVEVKADVPYLSPYGLRYMVELIMAEHSFRIANAVWLQEKHPMVYWNWLWYCSRFNAPSGLFFDHNQLDGVANPEFSSPWLGPVLTAWRECTLRAKAEKVIRSGGTEGVLGLRDIISGISEKDCEIVHHVMSNVAEGIHGVAQLLTRLSRVKSLLDHFGGSQGRKIYMAVLTMVHLFKPHALVQASVDLPLELSKVSMSCCCDVDGVV